MLIKRGVLERLFRARTVFTGSALRPLPRVLQMLETHRETTQGPFWFLTNEAGKPVQGYPLTSLEQRYLAGCQMALPSYPTSLRVSYSAWWQNQKWYAPLLYFGYEPLSTGEGIDRDLMQAFVKSEAERLIRVLAKVPGATVLLDDNPLLDYSMLCLLVPMQTVIKTYPSATAWFQLLASLFDEPGALPLGTLVYLDMCGPCRHQAGCTCGVCNEEWLSYGCRMFDMTAAPLSDEASVVTAWLHESRPHRVEWGQSGETALHNARLVYERLGYEPVDLFCEPVDVFG